MSSNASPGPHKHPRILACVLCQHRKIKCDRNSPCSNCIKVRHSIFFSFLTSCGSVAGAYRVFFACAICRSLQLRDLPQACREHLLVGNGKKISLLAHCLAFDSQEAHIAVGECHLHAQYPGASSQTPAPKPRSPGTPCAMRGATQAVC